MARNRVRYFISSAGFFLASGVCGVGAAEESSEPLALRVEIMAPAGCPSADDFLAELNAQLPVRLARADEPAYQLSILVEGSGESWRARMRSPSVSGADSREAEGANCADALSILAMSAGLALEGKSADVSQEPGSTDGAPAAAPERGEDASESTVSEQEVEAPAEETHHRNSAPRVTHRVLMELGARLWTVSTPTLIGPEVALSWIPQGGLSWELHLRVAQAFQVVSSEQNLALSWTNGAIELCWGGFEPATGWSLAPCATTEMAAVRGTGVELADARSAVLPYGASGASLRSRFTWAEHWSLQGDVGAAGVWWAPQFEAGDGGRVLETVDGLTLSAGIALGWLF